MITSTTAHTSFSEGLLGITLLKLMFKFPQIRLRFVKLGINSSRGVTLDLCFKDRTSQNITVGGSLLIAFEVNFGSEKDDGYFYGKKSEGI